MTSARDLNAASVVTLFLGTNITAQHRENTKKMLTTLSSFVACSPGSSREVREEVEQERGGRKQTKGGDAEARDDGKIGKHR